MQMQAILGQLSVLVAGAETPKIPVGTILLILLAVAVITVSVTLIKRYRKCPSNRILVIYGKTGAGAARCVHGGAAMIWPVIHAYDYIDLEPFVVPIDLTNALSQEYFY